MASPAYSTLFLDNAFGGAATAAFLVPPGFVAVVRCIDMWESSPGGCIFEIAGNSGTVFAGFGPNLATVQNHYQWQGRQVIQSGHQLEVSVTLAANVYASGYLLIVP